MINLFWGDYSLCERDFEHRYLAREEISKQVFAKIHMFTTKVFIRYYCTVLFLSSRITSTTCVRDGTTMMNSLDDKNL